MPGLSNIIFLRILSSIISNHSPAYLSTHLLILLQITTIRLIFLKQHCMKISSVVLWASRKKLQFLNLAFKVMNNLVHLLVLSVFYMSYDLPIPSYFLVLFSSFSLPHFFLILLPPPTEILPILQNPLWLITICNRPLE